MNNSSEHPVRIPWMLIAIFLFVSVGLSSIAVLIYRHHVQTVIRTQFEQLESINNLKARQIHNWREQHIQTMKLIAMSPFLNDLLKNRPLTDNDAVNELTAWLRSACQTEKFSNMALLDADRKILLSAFDDHHLETEEMDGILDKQTSGQDAWFSPIHRSEQYGIHIAIITPVSANSSADDLFLVAIENITRDLFPLFLQWPVPSETAESLLVRAQGDNVLFLNDLRHRPDSSMIHKISRTESGMPAVMAVSGTTGTVSGNDYRGISVLAYVAPVADTPWYLITKIDRDEVIQPVKSWYGYVAGLTGTLVLLAAALILLYWRHQRSLQYQQLLHSRQAFEEQQRLWTTLLDNLPGIAYRCLNDRDWTMMMVSPGCRELTGYDPEELIGNRETAYAQLIHPSDKQRVWDAVQSAIAHKKPFQVEYRIRDRQGGTRWVWEQGVPVFDQEDQLEAIEGFIFEITGRKRVDRVRDLIHRISEEAIHATDVVDLYGRLKQTLQLVMDTSEFAVAEYDPEHHRYEAVFFAGREKNISTYDAKDTMTDVIRRTGQARLLDKETIRQLIESGEAKQVGEVSAQWMGIPLKTGKEPFAVMILQSFDDPNRFSQEHLELLETAANQIAAVIARKQAEKALKASESRYRELADRLPLGLYSTTPEGRFTFANPMLAEIMGAQSVDQLLEQNVVDFYPSTEARDRHLERLNANPDGATDEFELHRPDGKRIWVRNHNRTIKDKNGTIIWYEGIIEDMTQQKELEDKLVQSQRLESIGQLAGGIAHDFNNLLTPVLGYVELLLDTPELTEEMKTRLQMIQRAADSARKLVQQMLAYSRKQVLRMETVDLNALLTEMESMIRRTIPTSITIGISCDDTPIWINADRTQLEQIIINFVINARDALTDTGRITISTDTAAFSEKDVPDPALEPGTYAVLTVEDNGKGMEPETVNRIFEPFYTTKERGRGTGLGLAVVYGIVKQHKGTIRVYSEPGMGAIFRTYLPLADAPSHAPQTHSLQPVTGSGQTILLVEDNDDVRNLTRTLLNDFGYQVLDVDHPHKALEKMKQGDHSVDLLLTDVVMPDMNGPALYEQLKKMIPGLPVVFMSGYSEEIMSNRNPVDHSVRFVEKPFTAATLTRAIRDALHQAG